MQKNKIVKVHELKMHYSILSTYKELASFIFKKKKEKKRKKELATCILFVTYNACQSYII